MKDITICMMTCGEHTEQECLAAIEPLLDHVEFCEVRNVFPQTKALNRMIEQITTEFFIPVDADMVLDQDAWARIKNALNKHRHKTEWHSILFPLWDTLTEKKILALKILRTHVMKSHPFAETPTPDVEHYQRLTSLGFTCIHDYLKQRPIGKHIIKGKKFCYAKFRDVYLTYRHHNLEWDSGVFMGGTDLRSRAKAHADFFIYKWIMTNDKDYLHCLAGMMDGILSPVDNKSKSLDDQEHLVETKYALDVYMDWYMKPLYNSASGAMIF